jgi:hypothetical protein
MVFQRLDNLKYGHALIRAESNNLPLHGIHFLDTLRGTCHMLICVDIQPGFTAALKSKTPAEGCKIGCSGPPC